MSSAPKISSLFLFIAACGGEFDPQLVTTDEEPAVTFEEFAASVYQEPWVGGKYIVDGDITLADEEALRRYYDEWGPLDSALTVNRIFNTDDLLAYPRRHHLTYCVSDAFLGQKAAVVLAMSQAAASWHDQVGVRFEYVPGEDANCNQNNNNVFFDVRLIIGAPYLARAFFPSEGRSTRNVMIDFTAFSYSDGGVDFQGILRHELGHTLGFRHEHIWLQDRTCSNEGTSDARQVTSYDVNSVMHYPQCRPGDGGGFRQSEPDYRGARILYGLAPGQILASVSSLH